MASGKGDKNENPPILRGKHYESSSVFTPENLLREARRQKRIPVTAIPDVCILDPDGDMVRHLLATGRGRREPTWSCYHTDLYAVDHESQRYGIVGCAVGVAFAVLVAE